MKIYTELIEKGKTEVKEIENKNDILLREIVFSEGTPVSEAQIDAALELIARMAIRKYRESKVIESVPN